jgi:hypothetical protein
MQVEARMTPVEFTRPLIFQRAMGTTKDKTQSSRRLVLTERDPRVLESVYRHQLLTRDQFMRVGGFNSITRVNTRLAALVAAGMLQRKSMPIHPGRGSAQMLYFLSKASAAVLDIDPAAVTQQIRQVSRWDLRQVEHVRTENQILVDLIDALQRTADVALIAFHTEPELRQIFLNRRLVPDGWIAWTAEGKRFNCFTEADLHSEGLTVWRSKILQYLEYAESGQHRELFGFRAFRVLVLAKSRSRLENLRRIAVPAGQLFRFADLAAVNAGNIMAKTWLPASGSTPCNLLMARSPTIVAGGQIPGPPLTAHLPTPLSTPRPRG